VKFRRRLRNLGAWGDFPDRKQTRSRKLKSTMKSLAEIAGLNENYMSRTVPSNAQLN
jgi:hypothetical protein